MRSRWIVRGVKIAMMVVVGVAVFGFIVMSLWNSLLPEIFGLPAIGFWQALGLLVLSKILFGGFRGGRGYGGHWRGRMTERWENMTPEEREKFRQGMAGRCGFRGAPAEEPGVAGETPR
jgi:hypothetical protein